MVGKKQSLIIMNIIILFVVIIKSFCKPKDLLDLPEDSYKLIELKNENFKSFLKSEHFFVLAHSSWCVWSQKMERILLKIHLHLKLEKQPFYIGSIDNTVEDILSLEYFNDNQISYPKLFYYKNGVFLDVYNGRMVFDEIFIWFKKRIYDRDPYEINTEDQFNYKVKYAKKSFVYYPNIQELNLLKMNEESLDDDVTTTNDIHKLRYNSFLKASKSKECDSILFFYSTNGELNKKMNPDNLFIFSYLKYGNTTDNYYDNPNKEFNEDSIKNFCKKFSNKNYFSTFDEVAVESIFIKKKPALFLFRSVFNNKTEYEEMKVETLSYTDPNFNIVVTDIDSKLSYKVASLLGVDDGDLPALRIVDFKGKNEAPRKFSMTSDISAENIFEFYNKWTNGQLLDTLSFKSFTSIKENKQSSVLFINSSQFFEKVIMNRKNVVVMFYADWCTFCKKHLSLFDLASQKMNRIIYSWVYVDVGHHYDENLKIKKVPKLFVYSSNDKENPIEMNEKINLSNLVKFLKRTIEKQDDL
jgi:thiol-disulfide isomerase/thioredoxin